MKKSLIILFLILVVTYILLKFGQSVQLQYKFFFFFIFSALLITVSLVHIFDLKKKNPYIYLVNPPVLCTLLTFLLPFGITNFFLSSEDINQIILYHSTFKIFFIVINALNFMWFGYWIAQKAKCEIYNITLKKLLIKKNLILESNDIKFYYLITFTFFSLLAFLIMSSLDIYGYSSNPESVIKSLPFIYFLQLIFYLNNIVLIIMTYLIITRTQKKVFKFFYLFIIIISLIYGVLSGFKSPTFYIFLIILSLYYICKNKISFKLTLLLIFALYFSYYPSDIIRTYDQTERNQNKQQSYVIANNQSNIDNPSNLNLKKTVSLSNVILKNVNFERLTINNLIIYSKKIVYRINMMLNVSRAVNVVELKPFLLEQEDTPKFLKSIIISPITAIIPRAIWNNKPIQKEGEWFSKLIYPLSGGSIAMTSFIYLYFAGGFFMVFVFFFLLGILQNIIFSILKPGKFLSTTLLFLIILPVISNIDSAIYGIISFFFREFIILLILLHIIFKKNISQKLK